MLEHEADISRDPANVNDIILHYLKTSGAPFIVHKSRGAALKNYCICLNILGNSNKKKINKIFIKSVFLQC